MPYQGRQQKNEFQQTIDNRSFHFSDEKADYPPLDRKVTGHFKTASRFSKQMNRQKPLDSYQTQPDYDVRQQTDALQQQVNFFKQIHNCNEERKMRKKLVGEKKTPFTKF